MDDNNEKSIKKGGTMSELINNSQERKRILKELIKSLHEGKRLMMLKRNFKSTLAVFRPPK